MLNRTQAPSFNPVSVPHLPTPTIKTLENGIEFTRFEDFSQSLASLDLVFPANNLETIHRQATAYAFKMLLEGTKTKSAKQLADAISYLGATLEIGHHPDFESIHITCLSRYIPQILNLLTEVWNEHTYPEKEWNTMVETANQQYSIHLQKTNFLAGKLLRKQLFGTRTDYGYSHDPELVKSLSTEILHSTFRPLHTVGPALALFSGGAVVEVLAAIEAWLLQFERIGALAEDGEVFLESQKAGIYWEAKPGAQQSTLKMGQFCMNARHPDSPVFNLTLEIFGGYFGSRLMSNIREDKGWTYGIYAQRVSYSAAPYWVIGCDIKGDVVHQAISEIRNEIAVLQNEMVGEEELEKVKNYMLGQFLGSITNCFALADRYKSVWLNRVTFENVESNLRLIQEATSSQVLQSAQSYLHLNDSIIALSGERV